MGWSVDHPRSRGVYENPMDTTDIAAGSSPLARGLHWCSFCVSGLVGIIPARAGFTVSKRPWRISARDHPRSRGVYLRPARDPITSADHPRSRGVYKTLTPPAAPSPGSSPLARGLLLAHIADLEDTRIIPARAGFTRCCCWARMRLWDHPRSRGVYWWSDALPWCSSGSSPLARGLRHAGAAVSRSRGIIPARAGFTRHDRG